MAIAGHAEPDAAANSPAQVFKDPYFLDFLGLRQGHDEGDLAAGILHQLEAFILELGRGFAFVERQKRIVIGLPIGFILCAARFEDATSVGHQQVDQTMLTAKKQK